MEVPIHTLSPSSLLQVFKSPPVPCFSISHALISKTDSDLRPPHTGEPCPVDHDRRKHRELLVTHLVYHSLNWHVKQGADVYWYHNNHKYAWMYQIIANSSEQIRWCVAALICYNSLEMQSVLLKSILIIICRFIVDSTCWPIHEPHNGNCYV
jgi:hypothetical protein